MRSSSLLCPPAAQPQLAASGGGHDQLHRQPREVWMISQGLAYPGLVFVVSVGHFVALWTVRQMSPIFAPVTMSTV